MVFVGVQDVELVVVFVFEIQYGIDYVFDDVWIGDLVFFGDMVDKDYCCFVLFGKGYQFMCGGMDLVD